MKTTAVIAAAGSGVRLGGSTPKQFILINGIPLFIHTFLAFEKSTAIDQIVAVLPKSDLHRLGPNEQKKYGLKKIFAVVEGGSSRQASVLCGLNAIQWNPDIVAIHDAARCLITPELIQKTIEGCKIHDGAILAMPVRDTLKRVDQNRILETLARQSLWAMQTPQAFRFPMIREAYQMAHEKKLEATDDAQVAEIFGAKVCVVEGSSQNIKITYEEDLKLAQMLLEERKL